MTVCGVFHANILSLRRFLPPWFFLKRIKMEIEEKFYFRQWFMDEIHKRGGIDYAWFRSVVIPINETHLKRIIVVFRKDKDLLEVRLVFDAMTLEATLDEQGLRHVTSICGISFRRVMLDIIKYALDDFGKKILFECRNKIK